MNDTPTAEAAVETPAMAALPPPGPPPVPAPRRWLGAVAVVLGLGAAVLVVALVWLVLHPPGPPPGEQAALAELRAQVQALSQRQAAGPAAATPGAPAVNLAPLESRVAKLEQRPVLDPGALAALSARVDAVAAKTDSVATTVQAAQATLAGSVQSAQTALAGQIGAAGQHFQALSDRMQADETSLGGRLDAIDKRLSVLEQAAAQMASLAAHTSRADRLRAAATALAAGQPLGDIPGAPPPLQRFATAPPPTEAALRLAFPDAARAAESAEATPPADASLGSKIWSNVAQAVTIRDGDRVLVGGGAAPIVARARARLEAGDLAGAVTALGELSGPSAAAMAGWVASAKSLLAARAALAELTVRS